MESKYYIVLISIHGLIRGRDLELGRDADTGGQSLYVVELAKALSRHPDVGRVDLLTRQVFDQKVDESYRVPEEQIDAKSFIVRLPCGPRRYLRKEVLWPYLDQFTDQAIRHIRRAGRIPHIIHGHYADAGYVGAGLASLLEVPFVFTGHSLGREKLRKLLEKGLSEEDIQERYNIRNRIEAEEFALGVASMVVGSTRQEITTQYRQYENFHPHKKVVIPPGVDIERFHPEPAAADSRVRLLLEPFLRSHAKPMILALCRPDERKNIASLIHAYAQHPRLRELANLVLVIGNREDIRELDTGSRKVLSHMLLLIDRYDLYGHVAYPKHHGSDDVPALYRLAAASGGVFVNVALTEPFGLTLIEAAASGVPIVATDDGGPQDIVGNCHNGLLVDPLNTGQIADCLLDILEDGSRWQEYSRSGMEKVRQHYTWHSHVDTYLNHIRAMTHLEDPHTYELKPMQKFSIMDRLLICDIDNTLTGDLAALQALVEKIKRNNRRVGFGVATGRHIDSARAVLQEWGVPTPDVFITAVGSEIHYGHSGRPEHSWSRHIDYRWNPTRIRQVLEEVPGIRLQADSEQRQFKISYLLDPTRAPSLKEINRLLRKANVTVNVVFSHNEFLDILPVRASKGHAVRYIALKWGMPLENILVAGDSGNDEGMLRGGARAVVVGNYSQELEKLKGHENIYFANTNFAAGVIDGIRYYDFFQEEDDAATGDSGNH
ncbi:sucrose-phosphate synthase [Desulfurispirillum indicum S5]|uniref:sucrose-phosphate synthase n=1 Tax=Desulfurispirillum indicum (strain ATCC BAA-1389 / DSM 22839 / S5) TaxID=653733 RepID=E6W4P2_DESIS|nr:HAD-IIB family hydrolase [Desulfurispirillum indicum]ADU67115.1 sucrose-phosphate synthase [Desulfurispirillum indicum S5]